MPDPAAIGHLRAADPVLAAIFDEFGDDAVDQPREDMPQDRYGALVRAIIGQQVSTSAAKSMWYRLIDRFGGRTPTPEEVLADEPEALRTAAGLSHAKLRYLRSLAEHIVSGELQLDSLDALSDEEVIRTLTAVKGIGPWSAHVFLIFHLARPDVLPVGDLAVRRAMMLRYALPELPAPPQMEAIAEPWRPYRSLASLFLWRSLRAIPQV